MSELGRGSEWELQDLFLKQCRLEVTGCLSPCRNGIARRCPYLLCLGLLGHGSRATLLGTSGGNLRILGLCLLVNLTLDKALHLLAQFLEGLWTALLELGDLTPELVIIDVGVRLHDLLDFILLGHHPQPVRHLDRLAGHRYVQLSRLPLLLFEDTLPVLDLFAAGEEACQLLVCGLDLLRQFALNLLELLLNGLVLRRILCRLLQVFHGFLDISEALPLHLSSSEVSLGFLVRCENIVLGIRGLLVTLNGPRGGVVRMGPLLQLKEAEREVKVSGCSELAHQQPPCVVPLDISLVLQ
mmetsp:Transcript_102321/g.219004  ORF Transcript_102321/g.219004 Transcript_102321/m.219004 type:complete len:298 (-) Transcript_102321:338-1231(-)